MIHKVLGVVLLQQSSFNNSMRNEAQSSNEEMMQVES
jgi:hypothetical protein